MTKRYRPNIFKGQADRDDNEKDFILVLKAYGVQYAYGKPGDGFDLLVQIQPMELWEIKNPKQPPSKRMLTEAELNKQAYCEMHGIPYRVLTQAEQAETILGNHNTAREWDGALHTRNVQRAVKVEDE